MKRLLMLTALAASFTLPAYALDNLAEVGKSSYDKALQAYSCVDYQKALRLFRENAESNGHALSQYMTGIMIEQGQGTDADVNAAFDWYMRAAKQGLTDAYYALGDVYSRGVGVPKDLVQSYMWFDLADRGGHKLARDMRDSEASKLQPEQLVRARQLVDEWLSKLAK